MAIEQEKIGNCSYWDDRQVKDKSTPCDSSPLPLFWLVSSEIIPQQTLSKSYQNLSPVSRDGVRVT